MIIDSIKDMRILATQRGGKCLTGQYDNAYSKFTWQCKEGHIWDARPSSIKDGCWCPYCAKVKKKTIRDIREVATKRGGFCLSKKYTNMLTKLKWKCNEGHTWIALPSSVCGGSWCPICSQGISERICRSFFEKIFNAKFHIGKYKWLLSPKNANMQLDGYNKKLKLAFEYQGIQHYKLNGIRFNKKDLDYQQQCDQIKRYKCKEKGITLIEVPYTIKYEDMEKFIINNYLMCTEIAIPFKNIDYKKFNVYSVNRIQEMQNLAKSKGGKCLSEIYINNYTPLKWICKENHRWETTAHNIRRGTWCTECSGNKKKTIKEMKKLAIKKEGSCLSKKYVNILTHLKWRCKKDHEWSASPSSILCGSWCPTCNGNKKRTILEMKQIAKSKKGECLSSVYLGDKTKLRWRCKESHEWEVAPRSIIKGAWCPICRRCNSSKQDMIPKPKDLNTSQN